MSGGGGHCRIKLRQDQPFAAFVFVTMPSRWTDATQLHNDVGSAAQNSGSGEALCASKEDLSALTVFFQSERLGS